MQGYEVVIGFETHAQLSTQSKIFSCSTAFGAEPNTQACAVDLASCPAPAGDEQGAVERAIEFGLAVGSYVAERSIFCPQELLLPDLPKGLPDQPVRDSRGAGWRVSFTSVTREENRAPGARAPGRRCRASPCTRSSLARPALT